MVLINLNRKRSRIDLELATMKFRLLRTRRTIFFLLPLAVIFYFSNDNYTSNFYLYERQLQQGDLKPDIGKVNGRYKYCRTPYVLMDHVVTTMPRVIPGNERMNPPSHIQLCHAYLDRKGLERSELEKLPAVRVAEDPAVCHDWSAPNHSIFSIYASSLIASKGVDLGIRYNHNCHSYIPQSRDDPYTHYDYTPAQALLPENLISRNDAANVEESLVESLCHGCISHYESTSPPDSFSGVTHHCFLFPGTAAAQGIIDNHQELPLTSILPSFVDRLRHMTKDWIDATGPLDFEDEHGVVIQLDEKSTFMDMGFYDSVIPADVTSIQIFASAKCSIASIHGTSDCIEHGRALKAYFKTNPVYINRITYVRYDIVASTATSYARMMNSKILICPPGTVDCLIPALGKDAGKKAYVAEDGSRPATFHWFENHLLEKRKSIGLQQVGYDAVSDEDYLIISAEASVDRPLDMPLEDLDLDMPLEDLDASSFSADIISRLSGPGPELDTDVILDDSSGVENTEPQVFLPLHSFEGDENERPDVISGESEYERQELLPLPNVETNVNERVAGLNEADTRGHLPLPQFDSNENEYPAVISGADTHGHLPLPQFDSNENEYPAVISGADTPEPQELLLDNINGDNTSPIDSDESPAVLSGGAQSESQGLQPMDSLNGGNISPTDTEELPSPISGDVQTGTLPPQPNFGNSDSEEENLEENEVPVDSIIPTDISENFKESLVPVNEEEDKYSIIPTDISENFKESLVPVNEEEDKYSIIPTDISENFKQSLVPVHEFHNEAIHDYTFHLNPPWPHETDEGLQYSVYKTQVEGTEPVYAFWNAGFQEHTFHFGNPWTGEDKLDIQFYAYPQPVEGTVPVYTFWNDAYQSHSFHLGDEWEGEIKRDIVAFYAFPLSDTGDNVSQEE